MCELLKFCSSLTKISSLSQRPKVHYRDICFMDRKSDQPRVSAWDFSTFQFQVVYLVGKLLMDGFARDNLSCWSCDRGRLDDSKGQASITCERCLQIDFSPCSISVCLLWVASPSRSFKECSMHSVGWSPLLKQDKMLWVQVSNVPTISMPQIDIKHHIAEEDYCSARY